MAISKERLEELFSLLSSTKNFEQKGMVFADFIGRENAESLRRRYYNMKDRCYNSKSVAYKNYGERNITICKEWLEDKYNFYIWALRNGFDISLTLDRIDNNCGYYPNNCRWVDRKIQNNNKRNIKRHKVNGEFLTITEASKKFGISFKKLESRMRLNNLSLEDAINLGAFRKQNSSAIKYDLNGKKLTLKEMERLTGVKSHTIYKRIHKGQSLEQAIKGGLM